MNFMWGALLVQLLTIVPLIYFLVLIIKLIRRGIIALDIYIEKNKKNSGTN